jgi:hypothetical protein
MIAIVALTLLAFSSFTLMDFVADYSKVQNQLQFAGYGFCVVALITTFRLFWIKQ